MDESFSQSLTDYALSGHAHLHASTPENTRFIFKRGSVFSLLSPRNSWRTLATSEYSLL